MASCNPTPTPTPINPAQHASCTQIMYHEQLNSRKELAESFGNINDMYECLAVYQQKVGTRTGGGAHGGGRGGAAEGRARCCWCWRLGLGEGRVLGAVGRGALMRAQGGILLHTACLRLRDLQKCSS